MLFLPANILPLLYLWHLAEHHVVVWICLHRFLSWRKAEQKKKAQYVDVLNHSKQQKHITCALHIMHLYFSIF